MKYLRLALLSLCLIGSGTAAALDSPTPITDLNAILISDSNNIYTLTSTDNADIIHVHNQFGDFLWKYSYVFKVISWKHKNGVLYVFSKSRYIDKTFLDAFDSSGNVKWMKNVNH